MSVATDKPVIEWVNIERKRCGKLARKFAHGKDAGFLLFLIDNAYTITDDLTTARRRYEEAGGDGDIEDLL